MLDGQKEIARFSDSMMHFLLEKNKRYGNSALEPVNMFGKFIEKGNKNNGILIRLDDKMNRIINSDELRKNDIIDLIGYLHLLAINNEWTELEELID